MTSFVGLSGVRVVITVALLILYLLSWLLAFITFVRFCIVLFFYLSLSLRSLNNNNRYLSVFFVNRLT